MKAIVSETEIYIVPEDANEEFALRQWNSAHAIPLRGFILEVQTKPVPDHLYRYRFYGERVDEKAG